MPFVMVLNDGETFTNLEGCKIVQVPKDYDEDSIGDYDPVVVFTEYNNGKGWGMDYLPSIGGTYPCNPGDE